MLLTSARLGLHSRSRAVRLVCAASNGWVGYDLIRQLPNEELILKTLYSKFEVLDASTVAARELFGLQRLTASGHARTHVASLADLPGRCNVLMWAG